ncbi:hypothetical protein [Microbulbifer sp. ZKSA002]|uniref:hypothetical protein n=1 Tax=Microbulbifer sp. ZKSA002 TaxID=3243388 RepID=UPI00403A404B
MKIENINIKDLIDQFIQEQHDALQNNISEQSLSHQLAVKLGPHFPGWDVDCEYDREGDKIKKLMYAISPGKPVKPYKVVPDIIIHRRMTTDNLLAIEVKKSTNKETSFKDKSKLEAFRDQLGYRHTLFVRFATGQKEVGIDELDWI